MGPILKRIVNCLSNEVKPTINTQYLAAFAFKYTRINICPLTSSVSKFSLSFESFIPLRNLLLVEA